MRSIQNRKKGRDRLYHIAKVVQQASKGLRAVLFLIPADNLAWILRLERTALRDSYCVKSGRRFQSQYDRILKVKSKFVTEISYHIWEIELGQKYAKQKKAPKNKDLNTWVDSREVLFQKCKTANIVLGFWYSTSRLST
jgi:aspartate ammonia-lyase